MKIKTKQKKKIIYKYIKIMQLMIVISYCCTLAKNYAVPQDNKNIINCIWYSVFVVIPVI